MWYLLGLLALFHAFLAWKLLSNSWDDILQVMGMAACGIPAIIMLAIIPLHRADSYSNLAQRDALQSTYAELRANPLEMATVGKQIAEWNAWLASAKYWNQTQWDWYWPDEVMDAKPIH